MKTGAQLYTVRRYTQSMEELEKTLGKIADIGFSCVQMSATCPYDGEKLSALLGKYGLECAVTHYDPKKIKDDPCMVAEEHKKFACRYVGLGSYQDIFQKYDIFKSEYLTAAKSIADRGCLFLYHNHSAEFEKFPDGRNVLERLRDETSPDILGFIPDCFWIQHAGADPVSFIRDFAGRIPCVHFKDMGIVGGERRMLPCGSGNMDHERLIAACADSGCEYVLIELDDTYGQDPFVSLSSGLEYLRSLGLS